jgi:transglutaminase-like putative cysteine protease
MPGGAGAVLTHFIRRLNKLPRDSRDTLFLLLVIAWVLLPQTPYLPWWCSTLAACVLLWRSYLVLAMRPLPGAWWRLGLLALAFAATFLTYSTLLGIDAGVTMLAVLLALKTLELRARRDAFVAFFLGFFCILANFFYSQSLLTAASLLVGLVGLLTVLVNAHTPVGKPPLLAAAKTAGYMVLVGAPIMLLLFLFFPRPPPLWGVSSDALLGRSGLSAKMQVGNIARLALDDSVAMRIKFDGQAPPPSDVYFRGPVLSIFDGREWLPSKADVTSPFNLTASLVVTGAPIRYQVTMSASSKPWLMVMDAAVQNPMLPGYQTTMQTDLQWFLDRPANDALRYTAQSYSNFQHGPKTAVIALREFVELPPGFNPRTLALANDIRRDARYIQTSTGPLVDLVLNKLRTGGYGYTLEPGAYGQNTADVFWFDKKEGFCEHIASSFVILMRALDVPARIVTGYQGGEQNAVDGLWTIRQSDAHAWAEVWYEGRGWVRVDPTSAVSPGRTNASQRLAAPQNAVSQALTQLNPRFWLQLRANWEAINNAWTQRVLNYTQDKQLSLLRDLGFKSPSWQDLGFLLMASLLLISLLGAAWSLWERSQHDPWLRLLGKARTELAKSGIVSTSATSPRELSVLLKTQHGSQHDALQRWLIQLEAQRYAAATSDKNLKQLRQQFKRLVWPA